MSKYAVVRLSWNITLEYNEEITIRRSSGRADYAPDEIPFTDESVLTEDVQQQLFILAAKQLSQNKHIIECCDYGEHMQELGQPAYFSKFDYRLLATIRSSPCGVDVAYEGPYIMVPTASTRV